MDLPKSVQWVVVAFLVVALFSSACSRSGNSPPQISSVSADRTSVAPGEVVVLTCVASDPDGDSLTYSWSYSGPCEAPIAGTSSTVDWSVAGALGTYTVSVVVDDGRGGTDQGSCLVTVGVTVTTGSIDVKSSPAGARVFLDGVDTGNVAPYVIGGVDAGEYTVMLTLTGHKNKDGTVTVAAGEASQVNWQLEEAEIATLTLQPGGVAGNDGHVFLATPNDNYGSEGYLFAGSGTADETCRSYLQFDLGSIPGAAVVIDAHLALFYMNSVGTGPAPIGAYRVTGVWDEDTMDWGSQPESEETPEDINSVPDTVALDWEYWDIGDLVQGWVDGSIPNHGVLLKDSDEATEKAYKAFYSSDFDPDPNKRRPKLVVVYYEP
jgi:hypothetical protein